MGDTLPLGVSVWLTQPLGLAVGLGDCVPLTVWLRLTVPEAQVLGDEL